MNLLFRLLRIILCASVRPKLDFFDDSIVRFRVYPHDLDLNLHMTNSRYLSLMDLGRTDLLLRTRFFRYLRKHRLQPVLGSANVRFRRALHIFQEFTLHTRVIGWDEKWLYIDQRIKSNGHLITSAIVKALFLKKKRAIPTQELFRIFNLQKTSMQMNPAIEHWLQMEAELRKLHLEEEK